MLGAVGVAIYVGLGIILVAAAVTMTALGLAKDRKDRFKHRKRWQDHSG